MSMLRLYVAGAAFCVFGTILSTCLPSPDDCTPLETRCNGANAEICDGAQRWTVIENCNEVAKNSGGTWVCCAIGADGGATPDAGADVDHTCVPAEECSGGDQ